MMIFFHAITELEKATPTNWKHIITTFTQSLRTLEESLAQLLSAKRSINQLSKDQSLELTFSGFYREEVIIMLDEVSHVLQHFRPKPAFFQNEQDFVPSQGRRKKTQGFSSVHYNRADGTLLLNYLHDRHFLLKFQVKCSSDSNGLKMKQPISVTCLSCQGPSGSSQRLKQTAQELCATSNNDESLFSVISKLLQSLQKSLPLLPLACGDAYTSNASVLRRCDNSQVLDFQILLLRCAASSKRSTTLCTPVPEACRDQHDGEVQPYRVVALTDRMKDDGSAPALQHEFLTFCQSLPWTGTLQISKKQEASTITTNNTVHLTLDLKNGDASPHFTQRAELYGTHQVFHGTNPENIWSILTHGLLNLSNNASGLSKNGQMLGAGVYFSTAYNVAAFFAKGCSNNKKTNWWHHPSILKFLPSSVKMEDNVSCYTVLEATILQPSSGATRRDGKYFVVPNGAADIQITRLHLILNVEKKRNGGWLVLVVVVAGLFVMALFWA